MIPVLQLDPLSLSVWMDAGVLGEGEPAEIARSVLLAAWSGDDFASAVAMSGTEEQALKNAYLGSCMWHEKRHFFDICISSYGAWRLRNMFVISANALSIAAEASDRREPLVFPMTAYCDPVLREVMGLSEPLPHVLKISNDIKDRKRRLYEEAKPIAGEGRSMRIDGQAQMEGLALLSQMHCLAGRFGSAVTSDICQGYIEQLDRFGLYRWIDGLSLYLGCHRKNSRGIMEIDHEFASALLVAGLCGRWLGKPGEDASYVKPSERVSRLLFHFGERSGSFGMTTAEAFERVDDAALALWGRRILQELDADLEESRAVGEKIRAQFDGLEDICEAYDDYLDLRCAIFEEIKTTGPSGLSPRAFGATWADRLRPRLLTVCSRGVLHDPTDGLRVQFGRQLRTSPVSGVAWAWAEHDPNEGEAVALRRRHAWSYVIEQAAPLAKLALAGRQHALMLFPELERIIADIEGAGVDVRFAPGFEWPTSRIASARRAAAGDYAKLAHLDSFVCDLTGARISVEDAQLLTAAEFRRLPSLVDMLRAAVGPDETELKLAIDWSSWIVRADLLQ